MHKMLPRVFPVRVSLVVTSVALFLFVGWLQAVYGVDLSELYKWLVGVIGVTVLGDTWRPSGWTRETPPAVEVQATANLSPPSAE